MAAIEDVLAIPDRPSAVEAEDAFDVLSNRRRRMVVRILEEASPTETIDVDYLSRQIAAWEEGTSIDGIDYADRKSVYTSLQQLHLPAMDEAGVVDFDERAGTITATEETKGYTVYLEVVNEEDVPWHGYYLGLAAISGALLVPIALDVAPFDQLSALTVYAFLTISLLASAIAHTYFARQRRLDTDVARGEDR